MKTPHIKFAHQDYADGVPQTHRFLIRFQNGYSVSMVYGGLVYSSPVLAYCLSRYDKSFDHDRFPAASVEVAIIDPDGNFVNFKDGQDVKGWVLPDEIPAILSWVQSLTDPATPQSGKIQV